MIEHRPQTGRAPTHGLTGIPVFSLAMLRPGQRAVIHRLYSADRFRRRLLDLGFIPGTPVETVRKIPNGGPVAVRVRGAIIALRLEDAGRITVRPGPPP